MPDRQPPLHVLLLPTCLVDTFRPSVGLNTAELLERAGCTVHVADQLSCCGQPAYNAGERATATAIAQTVLQTCERYDYVVIPSGSCAGMLRTHYPRVFADDAAWSPRALAVAAKTFELTQFLHDVLRVTLTPSAMAPCTTTYHDSCSGLRELSVHAQPRALLAQVDGITLRENAATEVCCGFGGLFCIKYPDVSTRMVDNKCDAVEATGADLLLGGDLGCLLNIAGRLSRRGATLQVRHIAEVLNGDLHSAPILAPEDRS